MTNNAAISKQNAAANQGVLDRCIFLVALAERES